MGAGVVSCQSSNSVNGSAGRIRGVSQGRLVAYWILATALSCDTSYGVVRRTHMQAPPDVECVRMVLGRTEVIRSVKYAQELGSREIRLSGLRPAPTIHTFEYRGEKIAAALQFYVETDGATLVVHSLRDLNEKPDQTFVDTTRPVMQEVERSLEAQCGMDGLAKLMEEQCIGVECER